MARRTDVDERMARAWLLDRLAGDERESAELRLFTDDAFYAMARGLEEELIRDFLRGDLSPEEHSAFEMKYFSTPELRAKVQFVSAFMTAAARDASPYPPKPAGRLWGYIGLAAAAALFAGISFRQEARIETLTRLVGETQSRLDAPSRPPLTAFALRPGLERSAMSGTVLVNIPSGNGSVRITLSGGSPPFSGSPLQVSLKTPEGSTLWSALARRSTPEGGVELLIPASVFGPGDYVIEVSESAGVSYQSYAFRVRGAPAPARP